MAPHRVRPPFTDTVGASLPLTISPARGASDRDARDTHRALHIGAEAEAIWPPRSGIVGQRRMSGAIESIYIAPTGGAPMCRIATAVLVAGAGIRGDRNFRDINARDIDARESNARESNFRDGATVHDGQITLIDAAEIERFNAATGLAIDVGAPRRNVVTRGVALNELVGKRFRVGQTTLVGVELCEPCATLGRRLARSNVTPAEVVATFAHRAGLRARIEVGGTINAGDRVGADT